MIVLSLLVWVGSTCIKWRHGKSGTRQSWVFERFRSLQLLWFLSDCSSERPFQHAIRYRNNNIHVYMQYSIENAHYHFFRDSHKGPKLNAVMLVETVNSDRSLYQSFTLLLQARGCTRVLWRSLPTDGNLCFYNTFPTTHPLCPSHGCKNQDAIMPALGLLRYGHFFQDNYFGLLLLCTKRYFRQDADN